MADQNNLPEAEDTKTRVTAKINPDTPGKKVPQIDLNAAPAAADKSPTNTMTGRTMKLQGLAGMAPASPAVSAPAPATAAPAAGDDTRTKRTVKLASLAAGPSVKSLDLTGKTPAAAPAPAAPAASTVTRRTQKLEALDTQDVVAMTEVAPSAADDDTKTRKATKISAVAAQPAPQTINLTGQPRQTVKVGGVDSGKAPASGPATIQIPGVAPAPARTVDEAPKTIQVAGVVPETQSPVRPVDAAPGTIQVAAPAAAEDTKTRTAKKVAPAPGQFKSGNVDDTVKLQRPAPRPAMPGSVAPSTQSGSPAVGGIKLNKPKPAPAPATTPAPATAAPAAAEKNEAPKTAEPTGNLGKDQTPPKTKKGLKVNTDAIKDLGSSPAATAAGSMAQSVVGTGAAAPVKQVKESLLVNISFAFFGVLALVLLVCVAVITTVDYLNIWHNDSTEQIELPIISEYVYSNLEKK